MATDLRPGRTTVQNRNDEVFEITDSLMQLMRQLTFRTRSRNAMQQALNHFVNGCVSEPGLSKGEHKKALGKATKMVSDYAKSGDPGEIPVMILPLIDEQLECIDMLENSKKQLEKQIAKHAKSLPVYEWWNSHPGIGAMGLGMVVGSAGYIGTFRKAAGLWQRMGLRNVRFQACSTWNRYSKEKLTKDEWGKIGYNPRRRAVMYGYVTYPLLNKQLLSPRKDQPKPDCWEPNGVYGQLAYDRHVEAMKTHPDWSDGHRLFDRHRIVAKRLLADLLKEWKRLES